MNNFRILLENETQDKTNAFEGKDKLEIQINNRVSKRLKWAELNTSDSQLEEKLEN